MASKPTQFPEISNQEPDVHREEPVLGILELDNIINNLAKLPTSLPRDEIERIQEAYAKAKSISILVTGRTGSGKSTLVNGISGVTVPDKKKAEVGDSIGEPHTKKVSDYKTNFANIDVTIWDSPGLQDGANNEDHYLDQIEENCQDRDLTIYTVSVVQTRFVVGNDNSDVRAMKKLTERFGEQFWANTVIVLTFANSIEAVNYEIKFLPPEEKNKAIEAKIQEWREQIIRVLVDDIHIPKEVAENTMIVPAGHYFEPHLPGCNYWLSNLWFQCLATIPSLEAKVALIKMNADRLKREENVNEEDFNTRPERQPIVVRESNLKSLAKAGALGAVAGGITGGVIGSLIGSLIGILGGPVGIVVGLIVGSAIGTIAGGSVEGIARHVSSQQ